MMAPGAASARTSNSKAQIRLSLVLSISVIALCLLAAAFEIWNTLCPKADSDWKARMVTLRQLALAMDSYMQENRGERPLTLECLSPKHALTSLLESPATHSPWVYRLPPVQSGSGREILVRDSLHPAYSTSERGANCLLTDGSIIWIPEAELPKEDREEAANASGR